MSDPITISSTECDDLLFMDMSADEALGELFRFHVQFESRDAGIDLSALLGTSMTVTLVARDGYVRHFNGMVCEASQTGVATVESLVYAQYAVTLVPKPWLLEQVVDCRIFTNISAPDIIKQLLSESGYTDVKFSLTGSYAARDYCVQYREDRLNFIHRLMEQEGIYYYFVHNETKHTMVLADGVSAHSAADKFRTVPYAAQLDNMLRTQSTISMFESTRGVDSATFKLTDYNPLTPKTSLLSSDTSDGHQSSKSYSAFDFPGSHGEAGVGQHYANVRAEAFTASRSRYSGMTDACSAQIGNLFTLSDYPHSALNQEYLITGTSIQVHGGGHASGSGGNLTFRCHFRALSSRLPFRKDLKTEKPKVVGMQTAVVTGSDTDEEIAVDKYGRVQVTFHWNKPDKENAQSSCPVRVASPWAGKNWGAVSIPRVGQEVVVSFLEGDPDRPLIIGSVYNADNLPPYALPDNKTQSGIKSRSLLGTADDANELRFEDKKGSEQFFIHAQKDMVEEVENDHTVTIDHDEITTVKNDQTLTVDNDQTETVKHDRKITVQNDDKLDVTANGTSTIGQKFKLSAGTEIELVTGASSIVMKSSGDIEIKGVNIKITADVGVKIEGQVEVGIKAGATMDLGAGASLKAHSDGMLEVAGTAMTTVKGTMTTVKGDAMTQVSGGIIMIG
jgi:type VI secretion system secreted protein VgrG